MVEQAGPPAWILESTGDDTAVQGMSVQTMTYGGGARLVGVIDLISRNDVLAALTECDALGRESFLKRYGYGYSRRYPLRHNGRVYDSKAIVGVAYGKQHGTPLRAGSFSGGLAAVVPTLLRLGFDIDVIAAPISRLEVGVTYDRKRLLDTIDIQHRGGHWSCGDFPLALVSSRSGVEPLRPPLVGEEGDLFRRGAEWNPRESVRADRDRAIGRRVIFRKDVLLFEDLGNGRGVRFTGLFECVSSRMLGGGGKLESLRKLVVLDLVRKHSDLAWS